MPEEEIKKNRLGWDLLIDVDSKYLDYSKIYAEILVEVLLGEGIKNIGVKFSGSKGLHVIVPWKAFPEEISGKKTKDMFPEWPRIICKYLNSKIAEKLKNRILSIDSTSEEKLEDYCSKCNGNVINKTMIYFECPFCKTKMQSPLNALEGKRKISCTMCGKEIITKKELDNELKKENSNKIRKEEFLFCENCKIDSKKNPENFKQKMQSKHIDADLVLVSPRHLFRMPYSLHEKTSLASVVIDYDKIKDFEPRQADPMKIVPRNFMPNSESGEATSLLRNALEFNQIEELKNKNNFELDSEYLKKNKNIKNKEFQEIRPEDISEELYPPVIKKILEGIKSDGRKRALFILISFFMSLKFPIEEITKKINEWDKKNHQPLKEGYIKSQLTWYSKQKTIKLPPNFDKSYYKDIGFSPSQEELSLKNPVAYVKRKYFETRSFRRKKS
jgi:DNA primase catalytic subunit